MMIALLRCHPKPSLTATCGLAFVGSAFEGLGQAGTGTSLQITHLNRQDVPVVCVSGHCQDKP